MTDRHARRLDEAGDERSADRTDAPSARRSTADAVGRPPATGAKTRSGSGPYVERYLVPFVLPLLVVGGVVMFDPQHLADLPLDARQRRRHRRHRDHCSPSSSARRSSSASPKMRIVVARARHRRVRRRDPDVRLALARHAPSRKARPARRCRRRARGDYALAFDVEQRAHVRSRRGDPRQTGIAAHHADERRRRAHVRTSRTASTLFETLAVQAAGDTDRGPRVLRRGRRLRLLLHDPGPPGGRHGGRRSTITGDTVTLEAAEAAAEEHRRRREAPARRRRRRPAGNRPSPIPPDRQTEPLARASARSANAGTRTVSAFAHRFHRRRAAARRVRRRRTRPSARRVSSDSSSMCSPRNVVAAGCVTCVPLNTRGNDQRNARLRERADDGHVEQPVVHRRVRRDVHPARVRGPVADRDEPGLELVRVAVDRQPERVRLVDRERAHRRPRRTSAVPEIRCTVFAQRFASASKPDAVTHVYQRPFTRPRSTTRSRAGRQHVERRERLLRVVAELAREVVARAGRHDREPARRCRPRPPRPPTRRRRRRTRSGRARPPRLPSRSAPVRRVRATPRPRTPAAEAARVMSSSIFRVRPRPAAGLTIIVHGTAGQRSSRRTAIASAYLGRLRMSSSVLPGSDDRRGRRRYRSTGAGHGVRDRAVAAGAAVRRRTRCSRGVVAVVTIISVVVERPAGPRRVDERMGLVLARRAARAA